MTSAPERSARAGFTLLEVLVAVSILGLGLTVILSSQVGLFSSSRRAENLSLATHLARCRISETEVELLKKGFPLTDTLTEEGRCCQDDSSDDEFFRCARKIERVQLPQPAGFGTADGGLPRSDAGLDSLGLDGGAPPSPASLNLNTSALSSALSPGGALSAPGSLGPLGALAAIGQSNGAVMGGSSMSSFSSFMGTASGGLGVQGMVPMLMSMVYPDLKRMLEASIRKVTVTVTWKEGSHEQKLPVIYYVTNPMMGLDPNAAKALQGMDALMNSTGAGAAGLGTTGVGTTGVGTTGTTGFGSGFGLPGGFGR